MVIYFQYISLIYHELLPATSVTSDFSGCSATEESIRAALHKPQDILRSVDESVQGRLHEVSAPADETVSSGYRKPHPPGVDD